MHGHNHSPRGPTAGHQRGLPSVLTPLQLSSSEPRPPKSPLVHIFSSICLFPRVSTLEHLIHLPPLSLSFSFSLWITLTLKHHFVRFVLSSSVSPGTSCLSFHLNLAARHLFKPAPNVGSICPVWPLPRCIVRPFFTSPPPPYLSSPCLPLPLCGHAGANVPSISLLALLDLDHSGSGPLHPGSVHLLLVRGHPQGGEATLPVARPNEELWSEQQRAWHHR